MKENIPKGRITFINEVLCKYDPAGTTSPDSDEYLTEAEEISKTLWKALEEPDDAWYEYHEPVEQIDIVFNVILGVLWQKFGFTMSARTYETHFRQNCVDYEDVRLAAKEILEFLSKS